MFNPEKLLGGLLRSGLSGKGTGSLVSGGAMLGLLGVAMEAVEHYMNRPQAVPQGASPPPPPPQAASGMPRPPIGSPPPPPSGQAVPSPPVAETRQNRAVLLIRAMIAAANADGAIDAQERGQIMEKLKTADLSPEEHQFIVQELLAPRDLQSIADEVETPDTARQVYAASLLAITVDTEAEQRYLSDLARQMGLDQESVDRIHQQLGKQP